MVPNLIFSQVNLLKVPRLRSIFVLCLCVSDDFFSYVPSLYDIVDYNDSPYNRRIIANIG